MQGFDKSFVIAGIDAGECDTSGMASGGVLGGEYRRFEVGIGGEGFDDGGAEDGVGCFAPEGDVAEGWWWGFHCGCGIWLHVRMGVVLRELIYDGWQVRRSRSVLRHL